eukprot:991754-Pyramimonas_sp.AAC.1
MAARGWVVARVDIDEVHARVREERRRLDRRVAKDHRLVAELGHVLDGLPHARLAPLQGP